RKTETMDSESTPSEFKFHDGRRYHNVESSVYPQHFLMRYLMQNNFSAPINHILTTPGAKILDVG
ncbi:26263_t:CDS:1, partial [Gigaspora rosea]